VHAVVASEEGSQMVYLGPDSHTGLTATHPGPELTPESEVRAAALPALLTPAELGRARLMKIDVEGAESDVIAGLAPRLAVTNPDLEIVIELHAGDRTAMFETLEAAGFHPYRLDIDDSPLRYWQLTEPPRPHRLREALNISGGEGELDVIFSRVEAELL
jgi:Methyltransferase FkbM domain